MQSEQLSSAEKKALLLSMAKQGMARPSEPLSLGRALTNYIAHGTESYDPEFEAAISAATPFWLRQDRPRALQVVREWAFALADAGAPKPEVNQDSSEEHKHKVSLFLSLMRSSGYECDAVFAADIRRRRPDWVKGSVSFFHKTELLELARRGDPRPREKSHDPHEAKLGLALRNFLSPDRAFDQTFYDALQAVAPQWLDHRPKRASRSREEIEQDKATLLAMARDGHPRPRATSEEPTESRLGRFCDDLMKDPSFQQHYEEIAPHWFVWHRMTALRAQLLLLAEHGEPRPRLAKSESVEEHQLARMLATVGNPNHSHFDAEYYSQLRELAPHWFRQHQLADALAD